MKRSSSKTIEDFGAQWTRFRDNSGYYASLELFRDIAGPDFDMSELQGACAVDVGSGTGRIVEMLLAAGASKVVAVEPSAAFEVLKENTRDQAERIEYQNLPGHRFQASDLDVAVSFGVLHHIPEPDATVQCMFESLKPGGVCLIWLYGHEGNEVYMALAMPLRSVTRRLPDAFLRGLSAGLNLALVPYVAACRLAPLPLRDYMLNHFGKLTFAQRTLTIFDQLNPAYAKYYRREEAIDLLERAGFVDVAAYHRHGYSWTVTGRRPAR